MRPNSNPAYYSFKTQAPYTPSDDELRVYYRNLNAEITRKIEQERTRYRAATAQRNAKALATMGALLGTAAGLHWGPKAHHPIGRAGIAGALGAVGGGLLGYASGVPGKKPGVEGVYDIMRYHRITPMILGEPPSGHPKDDIDYPSDEYEDKYLLHQQMRELNQGLWGR